jgi:hypothetical protein
MITEKELIEQLNKINKEIRLPLDWKKENREILKSQIAATSEEKTKVFFGWAKFINRFKCVSQPVVAVFLISLFVLGGCVAGLQAAKDAKPGDSLYIAKIINEKAQLALTFDEQKKAELGIKFATNRIEELKQVLAEPEAGEEKEARVEKLVNDFKKEIKDAKTRIAKISGQENLPLKKKQGKGRNAKKNTEEIEKEAIEENFQVFSANLSRNNKGIKTSEQEKETDMATKKVSGQKPVKETVTTSTEKIATSSKKAEDSWAATETQPKASPKDILEQAKELLGRENYEATLDKLEEAGEAIEVVGLGQAKDESEVATTSPTVDVEKTKSSDSSQATTTDEGQVSGAAESATVSESEATSTN